MVLKLENLDLKLGVFAGSLQIESAEPEHTLNDHLKKDYETDLFLSNVPSAKEIISSLGIKVLSFTPIPIPTIFLT